MKAKSGKPTKRKAPAVLVADIIRAKEILDIDTSGNERHMLRNTVKMLYKNGDFGRLEELKELYFKTYPGADVINIMKFYYWYRATPISSEDAVVWQCYLDQLKAAGQTLRINPTLFSERGLTLLSQLIDWTGPCGNSLEEILAIYFDIVIRSALKFKASILCTPKSLLEAYGWRMFLDGVQERGGKSSIIEPSRIDKHKHNQERRKLNSIEQRRFELLEQGNIKEYDRIGTELSQKGIDQVYQEIFKTGVQAL